MSKGIAILLLFSFVGCASTLERHRIEAHEARMAIPKVHKKAVHTLDDHWARSHRSVP